MTAPSTLLIVLVSIVPSGSVAVSVWPAPPGNVTLMSAVTVVVVAALQRPAMRAPCRISSATANTWPGKTIAP